MMQQAAPVNPMPSGGAEAAQELPLRGLHLPAEPGFWPLAPGWWLVLAVFLLVLVFIAIKWYKRRQRIKRFEAIEQQLGAINFAFKGHKDKRQLLSELSMLLRRFEKFQQHNDQQVSLSGVQWIDHLNSYHKDKPFTPYQEVLTNGIYRQVVEFDHHALSDLIQMHIKKVVVKQLTAQSLETQSTDKKETGDV